MILQHQQQQQQQRDGRAVGAEAAMGLQAGLGALGGQGEQSVDQTTAMIAMQNAMMANPSVLQAGRKYIRSTLWSHLSGRLRVGKWIVSGAHSDFCIDNSA